MGSFLQQAEDILEIACKGEGIARYLIVCDSGGGFRILDGGDWNLPALGQEYGARAVFRVERGRGNIRVEGWNGVQRCLVQRERPPYITSRATADCGPAGIIPSGICSPASEPDWPEYPIETSSQSSETQRRLISRYSTVSSAPFRATRIF